jgi:hypothetical protein
MATHGLAAFAGKRVVDLQEVVPDPTVDATVLIQAALDFCDVIVFPFGVTYTINATLAARRPVALVSYRHEAAWAPTGTAVPNIEWTGAAGGLMIDWAAAGTTDMIEGGLIDGLSLDGNDLADYGIVMDGSRFCRVPDIAIRRCRVIGWRFTNGAARTSVATGPYLGDFRGDSGSAAASQPMIGLSVDAAVGSPGTTHMRIGQVMHRAGGAPTYPTAGAVVLGDSDNGKIGKITYFTRNGVAPYYDDGGSGVGGFALFCRGTAAGAFAAQDRAARKHTIDRIDDGNVITEATSHAIDIKSAMSEQCNMLPAAGSVLHYEMSDRTGNGTFVSNTKYVMRDTRFISAADMDGTSSAAQNEFPSIVNGPARRHPDGTGTRSTALFRPDDWHDGTITQVRLFTNWDGAAPTPSSTQEWRINGFNTQGSEVPTAWGNTTITPTASTTTDYVNVYSVTMSQPVARGDLIAVRVERQGGTDGDGSDATLIGIEVTFEADGPDSDANQVYNLGDRVI